MAAASKPDIVEWRVDHFRDIGRPGAVVEAGKALRRSLAGMPILFTRRSAAEGGQAVSIAEAAVVELYREVCGADFADLVDYEMSNPADSVKAVRDAAHRGGIGLICSYHNFEATPDMAALGAEFARAQELGGDVAKVSVMARSPDDVLTLLRASLRASRTIGIPLISISMGPHGALSRVMGFAFGSALTFGVAASASAPGQMPVGELRIAIEAARKALGG
jgi:3-dehydroquinate dehydratase-1